MVTASNVDSGIRIRGTPPNLFTATQLTVSQAQMITVSIDTPDKLIKSFFEQAPPAVNVTNLCDTGASRLHLRLPRTTPPGIYHGTIVIAEQTQPLTVEVEPRKRICIYPRQTAVRCKAGESADLFLSLVNRGNVPLIIPKTTDFELYLKQGIDIAIGSAVKKKPGKDQRRIDDFMDALYDGYGGVVNMKIQEGAGALSPGDSRDVTVVLQAPSQAVAGNEYWGVWSLYDYNYKIDFEVLPEATKNAKSKSS